MVEKNKSKKVGVKLKSNNVDPIQLVPCKYNSKIMLTNINIIPDQIYLFDFQINKIIIKNGKLFINGYVILDDNTKMSLTAIHSIKLKGFFFQKNSALLEGVINDKKIIFFPTIISFLQTGIVPIYNTKIKYLAKIMSEKIALIPDITIRESLRKIHFPNSIKEAQEGMNELFYIELAVFLHLLDQTKRTRPPYIKEMTIPLPFELTNDQKKAINDINQDMLKNERFVRIVYGDVGCGKTIIGLLAAIRVIHNGKQVVILAPTSVLALQIYSVFCELLPTNIKISLVTGKVNKKSVDLDTNIFIGTHALLYRDYINNLGLLIIDEQHRFGVKQRNQLVDETNADVIMMTATPIPRTFQMLSSGYIGVSTLEQKPMTGDKQTVVLHSRRKAEVLMKICDLSKNEKIIWVLRSIEQAEEMYHQLSKKINVFLVHSKIKEKEKIIKHFATLENGLLIATTVIEVGIDIEVNYIVIEEADMFGFSQLHQLRGRVGRRNKTGFCLLLGNNLTKLVKVRKANTGFEIAKIDYEKRGGGTICGLQQSGNQSFKFLRSVENVKNELKTVSEKDITIAKKVNITDQLVNMFSDVEEIGL